MLEQRSIVGGACVTEELVPGFKCSSLAFVAGALRPQIIGDLELKTFGLETYQDDEVLACSIAPNGSHFFVWPAADAPQRWHCTGKVALAAASHPFPYPRPLFLRC